MSRWNTCLLKLQPYYPAASAQEEKREKKNEKLSFHCNLQYARRPRQKGKEQAVSVSRPLRVIRVVLSSLPGEPVNRTIWPHCSSPASPSFHSPLCPFYFILSVLPVGSQQCWGAAANRRLQDLKVNTTICSLEASGTFHAVWCLWWRFYSIPFSRVLSSKEYLQFRS